MRENVHPGQIDRPLRDNSIASWIASAQQSPPTGNYHGGKGRIDVSFRLEIKKKHGRGWRMERSFSSTSNSSEEDVEIAVAFSTPLLLSLSLSLSTYVFLRKFTSRRGLSTYVRNGIINQSREFVMKNVKRSFITKLSIEERESDEIGLPSVSFVNRR